MPTYKNPGKIEFDGPVKRNSGGGEYIEFPYDVEELFGVKGRVPAIMTFDGEPYRGSMVKMGGDCHMCLLRSDVRAKIGKGEGDMVHVTIELDDQPRVVEVSPDVEAAWKKAGVLGTYRAMSFTHQREYVQWITEAKRPETRTARLEKSIDMIRAKQHR